VIKPVRSLHRPMRTHAHIVLICFGVITDKSSFFFIQSAQQLYGFHENSFFHCWGSSFIFFVWECRKWFFIKCCHLGEQMLALLCHFILGSLGVFNLVDF